MAAPIPEKEFRDRVRKARTKADEAIHKPRRKGKKPKKVMEEKTRADELMEDLLAAMRRRRMKGPKPHPKPAPPVKGL